MLDVSTTRLSRRQLISCLVVFGWLVASAAAPAAFIVPDPTSRVYYNYVVAAGQVVDVDGGTLFTGNIHSNADVRLKQDGHVEGEVSAVGVVEGTGTVSGGVTQGADPLGLPALPSEAEARALGDRILESTTTFDDDQVIDDVLFVAGDVRFRGSLNGSGTVIATGEIRLDNTSTGQPVALDAATRVSLIAFGDVWIGMGRPFRGLMRAGGNVNFEKEAVDFEGVVVADGMVNVKKDGSFAFVDFDQTPPVISNLRPPDGSFVAVATPEIGADFTDDLSGVDPGTVVFLLDGADRTAEATVSAAGFSFVPAGALAEGAHTAEVFLSDNSDNPAAAVWSFVVDTVPPAVAIVEPSEAILYNTIPPIVVEYSDAISGIDPASVRVAMDGVDLTGTCTIGAATATCPGPDAVEGSHTISAEVQDLAGNAATASFAFELVFDLDPPALAIIAPSAPVIYNDSTPAIRVEYSDAISGVDLASVVIQIDGVDLTAGCMVGPAAADCEPPELAEGPHKVSAEVRDLAGNAAAASFAFELVFDLDPPVLAIVAPSAPVIYNDSTPAIRVEYSDAISGVDLVSVVIQIDGVDLTAGCTVGPAAAECESPELAEGSHTVTAEVQDLAGNAAAASFDFELVFDLDPPVLAIVAPSEPVIYNDSTPAIEVTYSDALSSVDLSSLAILLDGVDLTAGCTVGPASASCVPPELAAGAHTIAAQVSDLAGNAASASFDFELVFDLDPPVIVITSPADGALVTQPTVDVTGTVADASPIASVTVNGLAAALVGDSFSATVGLVPGPNSILVEAADVAGNRGTAGITVTLGAGDTTPPSLAILSPSAGVFLTDPQPDVELAYDDDDSGVDLPSLAFTTNGSPLDVVCNLSATNGLCTPSGPLPDGSITLGVSLSDLAGNTATASLQFVVDTVGVEIEIVDPDDGLITADDSLAVSGTVGADVASVEVNGVPAAVSGGSFAATVPLREGTQMIVALGTKANGNTGTDSIEVTRDIFPPIVRIDSPRDGFVSVEPSVPVTGLVNDIVNGSTNARVLVNGVEAVVAVGTFMLTELFLVPGPNTIDAVATDAVGNQGRHSITVRFQLPVGARIGIDAGNGQRGIVDQELPEALVARVTDDLGNPVAGRVVTFQVTRNNGTLRLAATDPPLRSIQVPTDGGGRAAVLFTLGDTSGEGNNRVRATGLGVAGEAEFCASALAAPPDKILMVGGDNQRGLIGHPLPDPLEALVVDVGGNPLAGVEVTFEVMEGSGLLDGQTSVTRTTGTDGLARAVVTLGLEEGVNSSIVTAVFDGLTALPATFTASGLAPGDPADTRLSGVVLDNGLDPIPGARVFIGGTTIETLTDAGGQFTLTGVPVGQVELDIDPTGSPRPETFPPLAFETVTVAGQNNTLGQPILIPALATASSRVVGGSEDVTLEMPGVEGLDLTVFAGSATFADGSTTGVVSISQVHLDKVPMPPPSGTIFMPPAWTIQPAGVRFDPPARISIPNDGLPPGRVIDIFQFDHALNEFINVGKGTVSDDGLVIVSDPGFGITRAGWGGCGQPQPPQTCTPSCPPPSMTECTRTTYKLTVISRNPCRFRCDPMTTNKPDGTPCTDDGDMCTDDECQDGVCEHPNNLPGEPEFDWCTGSFSNFRCCLGANNRRGPAEQWARQNFPGMRCHNDLCDAARHAYWSCIMAQDLGQSCAENVGNNHEHQGQEDGQPCPEAKMDSHNNQKGRDLAGPGVDCGMEVLNNLPDLQDKP